LQGLSKSGLGLRPDVFAHGFPLLPIVNRHVVVFAPLASVPVCLKVRVLPSLETRRSPVPTLTPPFNCTLLAVRALIRLTFTVSKSGFPVTG